MGVEVVISHPHAVYNRLCTCMCSASDSPLMATAPVGPRPLQPLARSAVGRHGRQAPRGLRRDRGGRHVAGILCAARARAAGARCGHGAAAGRGRKLPPEGLPPLKLGPGPDRCTRGLELPRRLRKINMYSMYSMYFWIVLEYASLCTMLSAAPFERTSCSGVRDVRDCVGRPSRAWR